MIFEKTEKYTIKGGSNTITLTRKELKELYTELHKEFGKPSIVFPEPVKDGSKMYYDSVSSNTDTHLPVLPRIY